LGDFNLIRSAADKNNSSVNQPLCDLFNSTLDTLALLEIPLLDRKFTWSNRRTKPTLEGIDCVFFNLDANELFPNSSVSSQVRQISDHTPLLLQLSSTIPKASTFRLENSWLLHDDFLPCVLPAWHTAPANGGAVGSLAAGLKAVRREAKVWARRKRSPPCLHHNCKFLICLFDVFEEDRLLSQGELHLRELCHERLNLALRERATYWKQRGKVRAIKEGDSNTRFFFASACRRLRRNQIRAVEVDGQLVTSHDSKTTALTSHYTRAMGDPGDADWLFDISALYGACMGADAEPLVAPFTTQEAFAAVRAMNAASAPGPDGFGPSFYKAAWDTVVSRLQPFLDELHQGRADLERINRSYLVLLPKSAGAVSIGAFRPICLQNCDIKIVSKLLTTRLQRQLSALIDTNQTGFLQGRCISETFIHALEIIQCSQKRKAPAFVIKLDFAKAFDTVNWCSLQAILRARGFPPQWCAWVHELLSTSKTAILVNGRPGPWFPCRRGLRQGDPLSPYLFLLVADVLPRLIQADGGVLHPLTPDAPCPVLQYADDTLIVTKADAGSIERLKRILDSFAVATGLKINFGKSSVVPLHTDPRILAHCLGILECKQEAFPQNCLGLPLSPDKVRIAALLPSIGRADKYLAGWKAALLNTMGRAVLADSVLGNLLIYAMCATELPKGALDRLDAKRRAFLWTGSDKASGARCLVAWEHVCKSRESGGLGLKNLGVQNQCRC
jgi:hypothetical protein